jgi:RNA polymerase sigma-70 factor (ECF subfamily)
MSRSSPDAIADPTDEELLSSWRQGATKDGERLFERHYETVRRYFRNKVPAPAVRDLVQETFLACVEARERFRHHSSFRTYLLGIAHHVMVDSLRAAARRGPAGLPASATSTASAGLAASAAPLDLDQLTLADLQPAGEDAIAAKRERRLLLRALRNLRFPLQVVLELRYWESLSDPEIAEVLDEPIGTIKSRLRAGRLALEDKLAELASSTEELRSTLDSLHHWATRVRAAIPALEEEPDGRREPP